MQVAQTKVRSEVHFEGLFFQKVPYSQGPALVERHRI